MWCLLTVVACSDTPSAPTLDAAAPHSDHVLTLVAPLEGQAKRDWVVQNHVDHDPGPGHRDFRGTTASYDTHKGTDFRIRGLPALVQGVAVLAPADGQVLRTRDGQPDRCGSGDQAVVASDIMCGNGMVIDHGGGFQTQLCHLRQGSVAVEPGELVRAGDRVGMVGWSGKAEFPHVHLKVTHEGSILDPFVSSVDGARAEWSDPRAVPAASHTIWATGFTGATGLDLDDVQRNPQGATTLPDDAEAVAAYAMGLVNHGDIAWRLVVQSPGGRTFERTAPPRGLAHAISFTGKRRMPGELLEHGTWTGRLEVSGDAIEKPQLYTWSVEVVPGPVEAQPGARWEGCAEGG